MLADMLEWIDLAGATLARFRCQGGHFVSVSGGVDGWAITFTVGPKGTYPAPSREKAMAWVERFFDGRDRRLAEMGKSAATPGASFTSGHPLVYRATPEEQARYDAFSAAYVPPKRRPRRPRR